jgi:hypothetical protein
MKQRHLFASFAAAVAIGGLALVGSASGAQTPRASASPITIGIVASLSGPQAPYIVGSVPYMQAYIDYANAHGGVAGRHIKTIVLDDKSDPGQSLIDVETLWSQDHVLAVMLQSIAAPLTYIQNNQVPAFSSALATNGFSAHYTTVFSNGGQLPAWSAQTAYWIAKIEHRSVKRVAVMYNLAFDQGFLPFIKQYWTKLGATTIDMVPDEGPTADCSAYVLKWKSENIQYVDEQALESANCILAESRLGWTPPSGQGGPFTSEIGEAELIGKPYVGVVAGSPNTLYTGAPIYPHPTAQDRTYVGNVRKYDPAQATYNLLNGTTTLEDYALAQLLVTAMKGTIQKYGKLTSPLLVKYSHTITNYHNDLEPDILSFAANCKTGTDGTIWGFWHYNARPTAAKPTLYMVPTSGPAWVTNSWLGLGKCYLTQLATKLFPNG